MSQDRITILGATGSIGLNTLDVISRHPEKYDVFALTANHDIDGMILQCQKFHPEYAVMADGDAADALQKKLGSSEINVLAGSEGLKYVAAHESTDTVMAAIVGAAGLLPTLEAVKKGKKVLLANKESLVMAGSIFMSEVHSSGCTLLPIDSEHNAIFQCMPPGFRTGTCPEGVRKILLTASGGPFLETELDQLASMSPAQACAHPNWSMGRKISVDSATMMNKGLEVIEARWLFDAQPENIQVVIHPQSVIHSMVEYADGSILAQLGNPDMRTPIAHAMFWPEREESGVESLDLFQVAQLNFYNVDFERFPCLRLAYESLVQGGTMPAVLNAANEVAVQAFLQEKIRFTEIPIIIEKTLEHSTADSVESLETLLDADRQARNKANEFVNSMSR
jgi:1-deoxy-D-xylulose-5-phosphate reductoisomerase